MSTPAATAAPAQAGAAAGGRRRHRRGRGRKGAQNGGNGAPASTGGVPIAAPQGVPVNAPAHGNMASSSQSSVAGPASNQSYNGNHQPMQPGQAPPAPRGTGRRRGGGRGGRGGQAPAHTNRQVIGAMGGRTFGGQLSSAQGSSTAPNPSLQPDAAAFQPGQPAHHAATASHSRQHAHAHPPRQRRYSKSQAEDIATRTHEDIMRGLYECPICTSEVQKNSKVWSCKTCWTVFHLTCVKKWAANATSTQQQNVPEGEMPPERRWRCPGCNLPKDEMPKEYTCWCAKEINPKAIPGLPPHSCGQTCAKPKKCPHPCELMCHAGPCTPCPRMGPETECFCGKSKVQKKCVDTDYEHGWSCGKICGEMLSCGEHRCERGCHEGPCGKCEVLVEAKCYCGKEDKLIPCSERGARKTSSLSNEDDDVETWVGSFQCGNVCKRAFDCGKHFCVKPCHEQSVRPTQCPKSPLLIDTCACGKTTLGELGVMRNSCEDPVPHCQKFCSKRLGCGHFCKQRCHEGQCGPCFEISTIDCRCGRTTSKTICHQGNEERPQCMRICRTVLNCGRHECGERCCSGEAAAAARLAARRKGKGPARNTNEEFEAQHICTRTCGRELKCGNPEHVCQDLCHRGPCRSCREAVFEEIACNCGRTVLMPPQPCGTKPPPCSHPCRRPKNCGHPQVNHPCHGDEESCPKCPYLVQKACMCGKKVLKNQPCWSQSVSCGEVCGQKLRCGIHFCRKPCHRPGDCEDAALAHCAQQCGKPKTAPGCGHACLDPCHAPYPCKEDKPCTAKVIITCACQHLKQEVRCGATKAAPVLERKTLPCDDECLRLQRNAKLAAALNISADHTDDHIPYSSSTLEYFRDHVKWCQTQEREFRVFAADDTEKRLRFKPMQAPQRAFLHSLAEDFGLDSESIDPEPHRHVVVFKAPNFVKAPMKTLSQCAKPKLVPVEDVKTAKTTVNAVPFNAVILTEPRFALTIDELKSDLAADPRTTAASGWKIEFLPSEEIVLHSTLASSVDEGTVTRLKPLIAEVVRSKQLAKSTSLCAVDHSLNVVRREEDLAASAGGWSQVVKGAAASKKANGPSVGGKNAFAVLTLGRLKERKEREKEEARKRKEAEEKLVDNWEDAADAEGIEEESEVKSESEKGKGKEGGVESVNTSAAASEAASAAPSETGESLGESFVVVDESEAEQGSAPKA